MFTANQEEMKMELKRSKYTGNWIATTNAAGKKFTTAHQFKQVAMTRLLCKVMEETCKVLVAG